MIMCKMVSGAWGKKAKEFAQRSTYEMLKNLVLGEFKKELETELSVGL